MTFSRNCYRHYCHWTWRGMSYFMCVFFFFFCGRQYTDTSLQWNGMFVHLLRCLYHQLGSVAYYVSALSPDLFFFWRLNIKPPVLAYFLALFMATMAHKHLYSDIWRRSIYEIVWFGQSHKVSKGNDIVTGRLKVDNYEDIEKSSAQKEPYPISPPIEHTPPKATNSVRRGIDAPFRKQSSTGSKSSSRMASTITLPSYPNKSAKSENGSKFIETFRESALSARSESFAHFVASKVRKDPFPFPLDVDAPIPLPRLSEWVEADTLKGINVHNRSSF